MRILDLIIPLYNEQESIDQLIKEVFQFATAAKLNANSFKLILIENGSQDRSKEKLEKILLENYYHDWLTVIFLDHNIGYGGAIQLGLKSVHSIYCGWTHGDLQCPIEDVFHALELIKKQDSNVIVRGKRVSRADGGKVISKFYNSLTEKLFNFEVGDINAQPKIFSSDIRRHFSDAPKGMSFDLYLLFQAAQCNYKFLSFEVKFLNRSHGNSSWSKNLWTRYIQYVATIMLLFRLKMDLVFNHRNQK